MLPHGPVPGVTEAQKRGMEDPWEVREDFLKKMTSELSLERMDVHLVARNRGRVSQAETI